MEFENRTCKCAGTKRNITSMLGTQTLQLAMTVGGKSFSNFIITDSGLPSKIRPNENKPPKNAGAKHVWSKNTRVKVARALTPEIARIRNPYQKCKQGAI